MRVSLDEITIRTDPRPGDLGYLIHMHGDIYGREYGFGLQFESYVARGVAEFLENYDAARDRVWLCEHEARIIGTIVLMHRERNSVQLRYFLIHPDYRGIGLGKRLMEMWLEFAREVGYERAYLLTAEELHTAISLYERHGFTLTSESDSTAFGRPLRDQRYELELGYRS
ncbi:MAG: GNAT family N-acetyltransferase [Spirochaetota bacterium]|nr:GNAT family N-acetyltransferase [Spirochaetota bacterium]